jgi:hypothetical protein
MPRGDRTGPTGMGPMTGRGAGYCAGYGAPGFMNPNYGRGGMGYGARGRGRGWRHWYHATGLTAWQRGAAGLPAGGGFVPAPYGGEFPSGYGPGYSRDEELRMLREHVQGMEGGLEAARERLAELEKQAQGDEAEGDS